MRVTFYELQLSLNLARKENGYNYTAVYVKLNTTIQELTVNTETKINKYNECTVVC
jgi:hypothetical protein